MADYLPHAFPGDIYTFTADGAIIAGQVVEVGATDISAKAATTGTVKAIGVAGRDTASGATVPVYCRGTIHRLVAVGAITRGDVVVADATVVAGRVKTLAAAGTAWRQDLFVALESVADTGTGRFMSF